MSAPPTSRSSSDSVALAPGESRLFWVVFAVLALITLAPFWLVRFQPLFDLGCHLASISVWWHYGDPTWDFQRYYSLALGLAPYWVHYGLARVLASPLGLELSNRVVLSIYALSVPTGLLLLGRRFGRSPWLCLFGFALVWNFNLLWGFVTYCLGLGVVLVALAAFDAFCERPTLGRAVGVVLLGSATYLSHLLAWGLYLGAAGLLGLLHRGRSLRQLGGRFAVWLAPLLFGIQLTLHSKVLHMNAVSRHMEFKWQPLKQSLMELPERTLDVFVSHEDTLFYGMLFAAWLLLKLTEERPRRWELHSWRAFGCFLVPLVAYFVLPRSIVQPVYWWGMNLRFATPAAMLMALCVAGPIRGWRQLLLVPAAVAAVGMSGAHYLHWQEMNQFMAGFDAIAQVPEPGARVLVIVYPPYSPQPERTMYLRRAASSLYQSLRGGYNPYNFDEGFPLRYRERFPAPGWEVPAGFSWSLHGRYYDYVLTFQADMEKLKIGMPEAVVKVGHAQRWDLWKLPGPRVDRPPVPAYWR